MLLNHTNITIVFPPAVLFLFLSDWQSKHRSHCRSVGKRKRCFCGILPWWRQSPLKAYSRSCSCWGNRPFIWWASPVRRLSMFHLWAMFCPCKRVCEWEFRVFPTGPWLILRGRSSDLGTIILNELIMQISIMLIKISISASRWSAYRVDCLWWISISTELWRRPVF